MRLTQSLIAVAAASLMLGATSAQAVEYKLAFFPGPKHPINAHFLSPWAKQIAEMSNGSFKIKIYPGGQLGKGPAKQYKRALDRVAEITFAVQGFTAGLFKATELAELPGISVNAVDSTRRMWAAYDPYLKGEYSRIKLLGLWAIDRPILMTKKKPIKTLADMKGMKIRTPSKLQARVVAAMGGTPLAMPITKLYNALDRGLVDGVLVSPTALKTFKIQEVTKYFTIGLPFGGTTMMMAMNKDAYNELSPAHKDLIDKTTGPKWSERPSQVYMKGHARAMKFLKESDKHEVLTMSDAEQAKAMAAFKKLETTIVKELESEGIKAGDALARMRAAGS